MRKAGLVPVLSILAGSIDMRCALFVLQGDDRCADVIILSAVPGAWTAIILALLGNHDSPKDNSTPRPPLGMSRCQLLQFGLQ